MSRRKETTVPSVRPSRTKSAMRFATVALAIAMDRYSDEDSGENPANRLSDLNYAIGRLRLSDCLDFSQSYSVPELRRSVLNGCLFRAATLRRDVQDLLLHPAARLKVAKAFHVVEADGLTLVRDGPHRAVLGDRVGGGRRLPRPARQLFIASQLSVTWR